MSILSFNQLFFPFAIIVFYCNLPSSFLWPCSGTRKKRNLSMNTEMFFVACWLSEPIMDMKTSNLFSGADCITMLYILNVMKPNRLEQWHWWESSSFTCGDLKHLELCSWGTGTCFILMGFALQPRRWGSSLFCGEAPLIRPSTRRWSL